MNGIWLMMGKTSKWNELECLLEKISSSFHQLPTLNKLQHCFKPKEHFMAIKPNRKLSTIMKGSWSLVGKTCGMNELRVPKTSEQSFPNQIPDNSPGFEGIKRHHNSQLLKPNRKLSAISLMNNIIVKKKEANRY